MIHVGLNAHLLARQAGYRAAGIHGYMSGLLAHLGAAAPEDWRLTVLLGAGSAAQFPSLEARRSRWNTDSPLRRIAWEQAIQPWSLSGFDLYHALAFVSPLALPVRSVVTVYDLSFIHYPQVLPASRRLYLRLFTALSCRRARRVFAISHSTARDLTASLGIPPGKIIVAAPGYDAARYKPLPPDAVEDFRRRKGLPPRFWLFVGTLEPRKNLPMLLTAYANLPRAERLPLVLAGGRGWDYADIFAAIERYNLVSEVSLPGFVPDDELPLWYNSAECFIYPSVFEGFGLPVLEAMACGTPALVSDASSLPEVAGAAGLCLPPHAAAVWTDALRRAGADAAWREQAREQGFREAARYSWAQAARVTIEGYQQALL